MARAEYQEILKLKDMLCESNIPHELSELYHGWHICYPSNEDCICSIIEHDGSYGRTEDKLEIMGLLTAEEEEIDSVCGHLTAEEVFARVKRHYESEVSK